MDLTSYVDCLRREVMAVAGAGSDETRALADQLMVPLESAARLALLNALSEAMELVSRELAPGSVMMRLNGLAPEFVVMAPATRETSGGREAGKAVDVAEHVAPSGYICLRFADAREFRSATAAFGSATGEADALVLYVPTDGRLPTLRAVLDVLDSRSLEVETLTVHIQDLDNVFLAFAGPSQSDSENDRWTEDRGPRSR
ncbi:hypothetical protein AB0O82_29855 [Kitasatospora sp. NPDC088264]|uniref:hypothetical protein n=1 Tax=Kitasatospora sp. NPDC088264 TaxID=3155296 RepID=UPI003436E303